MPRDLRTQSAYLFGAICPERGTGAAVVVGPAGQQIHCALAGVTAEGWGPVGGDTTNVHYWEYNSTNLSDGKPVNVSQRHPASRQLSKERDAEIIANYTSPTYVLGGWTPPL